MSSHDDDDIEFDFFDEPETVEATQRGRRLPRRDRSGTGGGGGPRRPPMRAPTGVIPLVRLVGLIALAIAIVVALVFWVGACQGKSKHADYADYATKVRAIVQSSQSLGTEFATELTTSPKQADLQAKLQAYAQQEQQSYDQAQQIRPPGPLRQIHQHLVDALELRAKGLAALGDAVAQISTVKDSTAATQALTNAAQLLTASDVVWDELYRKPATDQLKALGITGVVIPSSHFVANPELVSARSFGIVYSRLHGSPTTGGGGATSGKHGDGLKSVSVQPQGGDLSTSTATTVKVSANLSFVATVEDSGDYPEVNVPVTLTINAGGKPIVRRKTIQLIQPAQTQTVTFSNFELPTSAFGARATIKVEVAPVAHEINIANNVQSYTVFFTLG